MNQDKLNHIIRNPEQITAEDARELDELTRNFPYFTMPWVLLSRYYSEHNDYRFEETLHKTALRISDRNWLYEFLHPEAKSQEEPTAEAAVVGEKEEVHNGNANEAIADLTDTGQEHEHAVELPAEEFPAETETSAEQETILNLPDENFQEKEDIEAVEAEEIKDSGITADSDINVETDSEPVVADANEDEVAAETGPQTEISEKNIDDDFPDEMEWAARSSLIEVDEDTGTGDEHEVYEEIDSFEVAGSDHVADEADEPELPALEISSMIVPDDGTETDEEPEEEAAGIKTAGVPVFSPAAVYNIEDYYPAGDNNDEPPSDFFSWLSHPRYREEDEAEKQPVAEVKDGKKELIERFIKNPAGVNRPKSEFFNAPEVAKKSDTFPQQIATETLARVFMEQQNYTGAIRIYEALILKNPEKSAYFAALIQKIKDEHKL